MHIPLPPSDTQFKRIQINLLKICHNPWCAEIITHKWKVTETDGFYPVTMVSQSLLRAPGMSHVGGLVTSRVVLGIFKREAQRK